MYTGHVPERTGMEDLHMIRQKFIMKLGSQRNCTEGRAEAIMSVVGPTDWFTDALKIDKLAEVSKGLVLGLYPPLFLQEIAQKFGGCFYSCIIIEKTAGNFPMVLLFKARCCHSVSAAL